MWAARSLATDPNDDIPATGAYAITPATPPDTELQNDGTLVIADASALVDGLLTITDEVIDATGQFFANLSNATVG